MTSTTTPTAPAVLTVQQFADRFAISSRTVRRMIKRGQIPAVSVASQWRIPREFADAQIASAMERHERESADDGLPGLTAT